MPMEVPGTRVEITVHPRDVTCSCGQKGKVTFSELGVIPPKGWVVGMHQRPAQLGGTTQLIVACRWGCMASNMIGATKQDQELIEQSMRAVNVQFGGKVSLD